MAKFTYTPRPLHNSERQQRQCRNCAYVDLFITCKEANQYIEKGALAFKDKEGQIVGYPFDDRKTFCSLTGATVNPRYYSVCDKHCWSEMIWAGPSENLTVC